MMTKSSTGRPYRSHRFPACSRCHKRRSRCSVDQPGEACLLCRMHGAVCSSASTKKDAATTDILRRASLLGEKDSLDESSHVIGPIIGRDAQVLEQYLPCPDGRQSAAGLRSTVDLTASYKPVYHAQNPRRRPSPSRCNCSRNRQSEMLDLFEPVSGKLIALYADHLPSIIPGAC